MRPLRAAPLAAALITISAFSPTIARADLTSDVDRLIEKWSAKPGTTVDHLAPVFLEHGHLTTLRLDRAPATITANLAKSSPASPSSAASGAPAASAKPSAASPSASSAPTKTGCTTVVLLAPRTSDFAFLTDSEETQPIPPPSLPAGHPSVTSDEGGAIRSKGGVATLSRCGKEQARNPLEKERFLLQSASPRTAVEILVVRSLAPPDSVETLLPERAVGPSAPRGDAGRPIDPGPLVDRLAHAEARSREAGAAHVVRVQMRASAIGSGQFAVKLPEGCHALDVIAEVPEESARTTDVDAEAHLEDAGRLLARDRGEATDAHLDFCLGEPSQVEVSFLGAAGPTTVTLIDAVWSLPDTIPSEWGPQARGDIAMALRRRHVPSLPAEPIETLMGVQGETLAPFAVEPGQCYLAVVALVRGDARSMRVTAEIGDRAPHDELGDRPEAAQISFCATTEDRAVLRVDAHGPQPWWVGLVWRLGP